MMKRTIVSSLAACAMLVALGMTAEAGHNKGCCEPDPCCCEMVCELSCCPAPEPTCCAAPAPTCCEAPAPSCGCESSCGCSAPAPSCGCSSCGEAVSYEAAPVVSSGCSTCGGGEAISYEAAPVVSSGCASCAGGGNVVIEGSAPSHDGVIVEEAPAAPTPAPEPAADAASPSDAAPPAPEASLRAPNAFRMVSFRR